MYETRGIQMHKKEAESRNAYNKIADTYDETFDGRFTRVFKDMLTARTVLKENDRVLDVACGNGELLARLNEKCPIRGTGLDISEEMVKVAMKRHPGFEYIVSSCAPMQFADGTFDAITVSASFHHFPDPGLFAREAYRVLKAGGSLYIAEPYYPAFIRILMNVFFLPIYNAGDVKVYSPKELSRIFTAANFAGKSIQREGIVQLLHAVKPG